MSKRSPFRVLIVEPAGLLWGSERALLDLLRYLDRDRFEIAVVCPGGSPFQEKAAELGIRVFDAPFQALHTRGRGARFAALSRLFRIIRDFRPDIVHTNQTGSVRIAATASIGSGAQLVSHVRMLQDARDFRDRGPGMLRPKCWIAVSDVVRKELEKAKRDDLPIYMIHDPFDIEEFDQSVVSSSAAEVRRDLGMPEGRKMVSMFGRVCHNKQQHLFVEAAASIDRDDTSYLIVGGDPVRADGRTPYREALLARIASLGLSDRVIVTGMRDDVARLMSASDAVVLVSEEEAFARVLLEALSVNVPVIGPAAGGPGEVIGDDERGLTFPAGDLHALSKCIERTLDDVVGTAQRSRAGMEWLRGECAPARHARAVERVYEDMTSQSARA